MSRDNPRSRRDVLKALAATGSVGAMPDSIARALSIPAHHRTGTIKDVEHIVVLTQENRSFDHYFGTMPGVRGFGDPRAVRLPSGKSVWHQVGATGEVLPYRPSVEHLGASYLPDPPHGWNDGHAAWNQGNFDGWIPAKGIVTMTHNRRRDVPFHFALAEAFTVCDAYHCSLMGPTDPNRYHLWSGWVGNSGEGGGPVITNAEAGYSWTTFPERLLKAGITWKVYQDVGDGLYASDNPAVWWGWTSDAFIGNYGDNALLYFKQFQSAAADSALGKAAKTGTEIRNLNRDPLQLLTDLRADVKAGRLPQVSWIAAPEAYTEHPNWPTDFGAWYIAQVLDALVSNPEVWSKTVFIVNYDEEGGFFDHVVPPTPPQSPQHGASTVPFEDEIFPGDATHPEGPYGLGLRVPMLVVSPWSRGGWVNSQVFDHTSIIQFIEKRFGDQHPEIIETNIRPWRRAVVGDLTSAFDFRTPNTSLPPLPNVDALMPSSKIKQPDMSLAVPGTQGIPQQEPGIRRSRALPYRLSVDGSLDTGTGSFKLLMRNTGDAAAVFQVRAANATTLPRTYTVEPGKSLEGVWSVAWSGRSTYDLQVHGPNGFFRAFRGSSTGRGHAQVEVNVGAGRRGLDQEEGELRIAVRNRGERKARITVSDRYSGRSHAVELQPGQVRDLSWSCERSGRWYDLSFTEAGDPEFRVQLAGRMETGAHGISDPQLGR